ncbi:MAG: hypothetical protein ISR69_13975 [Gammaproteobacteria bacterium]|nr:hypothetical protein [Gammaproteobacteria bacterium]
MRTLIPFSENELLEFSNYKLIRMMLANYLSETKKVNNPKKTAAILAIRHQPFFDRKYKFGATSFHADWIKYINARLVSL